MFIKHYHLVNIKYIKKNNKKTVILLNIVWGHFVCINILNEIIFPDPFQLKLHFYLNIYILNYLLFNYFYLFKNDTHQIKKKKNILQFSSFIILGLTNYYFFIFLQITNKAMWITGTTSNTKHVKYLQKSWKKFTFHFLSIFFGWVQSRCISKRSFLSFSVAKKILWY